MAGDKVAEAECYGSGQHPVNSKYIDRDASHIVRALVDAGHQAYIVGGAVRDLWLGCKPKDFDLGTTASNAEIRKLFRWSRTIGKRFPIVHVYRKPRKVFEISTFRALGPDVYGEVVAGTAAEDALRRDLTINALMYDVVSNEVLDFVGGVQDLRDRRIRVIGDPLDRFEEDPVRIVRCYRHANRTGFDIDDNIFAAEKKRCMLLREVSSGRLRLEKEKDFLGEMSSGIMKAYRDQPFGKALDPELAALLNTVSDEAFDRYDKMVALLKANRRREDPKEILRLVLLLALAVPQSVAPPGQIDNMRLDRIEAQVEPWLLSLEVPRWKRPLALQALYGQGQIDQQIDHGFGKRTQRKAWFRIALYLTRLRYELAGEEEVVARLGGRIGQMERENSQNEPRRQNRRRRSSGRKRSGSSSGKS